MKRMLKLNMISVLAAILLLLLVGTVAYAHGHTSDQLENAGWNCLNIGPFLWKHCYPPDTFPPDLDNLPATIQVKVFDDPGYPFLGTELLIRHDLYHGQPCVQDGGEPYYDTEPFNGLPYYACHHFDRPPLP